LIPYKGNGTKKNSTETNEILPSFRRPNRAKNQRNAVLFGETKLQQLDNQMVGGKYYKAAAHIVPPFSLLFTPKGVKETRETYFFARLPSGAASAIDPTALILQTRHAYVQ